MKIALLLYRNNNQILIFHSFFLTLSFPIIQKLDNNTFNIFFAIIVREIIVKLLNDIVSNGYEVKDIVEVTEKLPDPKDVVFYAVTLSAEDKNAFLVTGNGKHFPVKPFIVTPAELVKMFENMDF